MHPLICSANLRHKQHTVGGQCADKDGSCHGAVEQVGPGRQEDGHWDDHSGGQGYQSNGCYDGGGLVDWRVADVAGQPSQVGAIEEKRALQRDTRETKHKGTC